MNILITGVYGFIGSFLVKKLEENHNIIGVVRKNAFNKRLKNENLTINIFELEEDFSNLNLVFEQYQIDIIIHCATYYPPHYNKIPSFLDIKYVYLNNIIFSSMLLELAIKNKVKLFINLDSFLTYNEKELIENNKKRISTSYDPYVLSKKWFKELLKKRSKEIKIFNLILSNVYGPNDNFKLIKYVINNTLLNIPIKLKDSNKFINYVYVEDVCNFIIKLLNRKIKKNSFRNFFIFGAFSLRVRDLVQLIREIIENKPISKLQVKLFYFTSLKLNKSTSLKTGLKNTIEYYKNFELGEKK